MILMIDNYDSFVYNLVQYLKELGREVKVRRNDRITIPDIEKMAPEHIVISPGPCSPDQAGISLQVIKAFAGRIPILGVCLGHQAIGQAFGGRVVRAKRPVHGKTSTILHDGRGVFRGLPESPVVGRYHSLVVEDESLPGCLEVTARTREGEIMGLRHREYYVEGVQFHPESVLTPHGMDMLANFLRAGEKQSWRERRSRPARMVLESQRSGDTPPSEECPQLNRTASLTKTGVVFHQPSRGGGCRCFHCIKK